MLDPFPNPGRRHTQGSEVGTQGASRTSIEIFHGSQQTRFAELTVDSHLTHHENTAGTE